MQMGIIAEELNDIFDNCINKKKLIEVNENN